MTGQPALHGIRVLDFSHYVSAAACGLMLADMGATVVKVERSGGGDDLRRLGPALGGAAASFQWSNRNKRGIVLDLKSEAGRTLARQLAEHADVLIENYSTGVMDKLGLGPEALLKINPGLVYCSVSAYGRTGPHAGRPGFDPIVQAESGLISITGPAGSTGSRVGAPVADVGTGLLAAIATLGALMARERSGAGQHVEVSLFDSAVTLAALPIVNYLASGVVPKPAGSASREAAPTDFYAAADGDLYIACTSDSLFARLATQILERPKLVEDVRFRSNALRFQHGEQLRQEIESVLQSRTRREWLPRFLAAQIPAGILNGIDEVLRCDEFVSRGLQFEMQGAESGEPIPGIALPFRFSATPPAPPFRAPHPGEHTTDVLKDWLKSSDDDISRVAAEGAFGPLPAQTTETSR
jgi:formyl-CoA transferase